jgi:HEAT repeat protein
MQALVCLARAGSAEEAWGNLHAALDERDARLRVTALEIFAQAASCLDGTAQPIVVIQLLADTLSNVRVAACRALAPLHDPKSAQALVTRLYDKEASVRKAAADSLRARGAGVTDAVLDVLDSEFEAAHDAALDALAPGTVQASQRLRRFAQREIDRLRTMRSQEASLPSGGAAVRLLCESLRHEARHSEDRLIRVVGLIGNGRAMELVGKSLGGGDAEARAAALEALETLGDKTLARDIITLLEEEPKRSAPDAVLSQIVETGSRWERALAIRSIQEMQLRQFSERLDGLQHDPDPLIAEAAVEALKASSEGEPMNTLQTVSTLERVLLLRDIPIFSELSPEDLQQIASIAVEQWYPAGTTIFRQDEQGDMMFVIVDGHVRVVRHANGAEQVLAERGPGDFVGEMAIIDSAPRLASLAARDDVRVLAIDGPTFKGILRERPEVSLAVLRSLSKRLRETAG